MVDWLMMIWFYTILCSLGHRRKPWADEKIHRTLPKWVQNQHDMGWYGDQMGFFWYGDTMGLPSPKLINIDGAMSWGKSFSLVSGLFDTRPWFLIDAPRKPWEALGYFWGFQKKLGTVPCSAAVDPQSFGVYGRVWLERPVAGRFRPADSAFRGRCTPQLFLSGVEWFRFCWCLRGKVEWTSSSLIQLILQDELGSWCFKNPL
jgi:hypothetical protein